MGLLSFPSGAAWDGESENSSMSPARTELIVNEFGGVMMAAEMAPFGMVLPESAPRHSRGKVKAAIRYCLAFGPPEARQILIASYSQLGSFVPDADAVLVANLAPGAQPNMLGDPERAVTILKGTNAECARLLCDITADASALP